MEDRADKFIETQAPSFKPDCNNCKHYLGFGKCKAFPDGIIKSILTGETNHVEILASQKGDYVYEKQKNR